MWNGSRSWITLSQLWPFPSQVRAQRGREKEEVKSLSVEKGTRNCAKTNLKGTTRKPSSTSESSTSNPAWKILSGFTQFQDEHHNRGKKQGHRIWIPTQHTPKRNVYSLIKCTSSLAPFRKCQKLGPTQGAGCCQITWWLAQRKLLQNPC